MLIVYWSVHLLPHSMFNITPYSVGLIGECTVAFHVKEYVNQYHLRLGYVGVSSCNNNRNESRDQKRWFTISNECSFDRNNYKNKQMHLDDIR